MRSRWYRLVITVSGTAAAGSACRDAVGPPGSVAVTSPIGDRLAVGRAVQFTAEVRNSRGEVLPGAMVTWSSSAPGIAAISSIGVVTGVSSGAATITAQAGGAEGRIALRVIAADLNGITADLDDAFTEALVAYLTSPVQGRVQTALGGCRDGAANSDFTVIETCLASVRADVSATTAPSDRALLASLALFLDHIERLLNQ